MILEHIIERYPVGVTTFTLPVPTRRFGNTTYKENGKPALVLSEVGFAVYYPTEVGLSTKQYPYLDWIMRPISNTTKGFSLFFGAPYWILWGLCYLFLSFIKVPIHSNAPFLPSPSKDEKPTKWPIVIFSPGLAGQLTTASHICARIASAGKVVIVMDHRDGSGIAAYPRDPITGKKECLFYIPEAASSHGAEGRSAFRMDQLGVRRFEVYSAWNAFKKLVADCDRGELTSMDDVTIDWAAFHDKADFSSVQFIGHSFGGATLFHILSTPPDEGFSPLPISHALFLDPWLEPFPKPVPGPLDSENEVKTLILHSEEFTLHKSAYLDLMLEMRPLWYNPPAYTIVRSQHVSFNDYILVLPRSWRKFGTLVTRKAGDLTLGFLDGHLEETLSEFTIRELKTETIEDKKGKTTTRLVGEVGDLVVH